MYFIKGYYIFSDCNLCLNGNKLVSSQHCFIEKDSDGVAWIKDTRWTLLPNIYYVYKSSISVFYLGFKRGMAPPIIGGTLPYTPGTWLTGVGISITHPPKLRVQTESVKQVNIACYYHYVHKPLSGIAS